MAAELLGNAAVMLAMALGGSYFGTRIAVARLEERERQNREEITLLRGRLDEHEGTLNSHSIQLAVLDRSNQR